MGVEVVGHVVALGLHVGAHLVEGGRGDHVAGAVHVPRDGAVRGAHGVGAGGAGGGTGVRGYLGTLVAVDDHTTDEVGVVVALVVDDGEHLRLHADLLGSAGEGDVTLRGRVQASCGGRVHVAEDTIVERGLVLVDGSARAEGGVGPVDFVSLADFHAGAVLPVELGGELGVGGVVVVATKVGGVSRGEELAVCGIAGATVRDGTGIVELASGPVLGAKVPVHVDGAKTFFVELLGDQVGVTGDITGGESFGSVRVSGHGNVTTSLFDGGIDALDVVPAGGGLGTGAVVVAGEDATVLRGGGGLGGGSGGEVGHVRRNGRDHAKRREGCGADDGDADAEADGSLGGDGALRLHLGVNFKNGGHGAVWEVEGA